MFTGLIQAIGTVRQTLPIPAGIRLIIDPGNLLSASAPGGNPIPFQLGESISVSGCCLTLAADPLAASGLLNFDAVPETLAKTTLGALRPGSRVNLERSVTPTTFLGGHLVQGHVDTVGEVTNVIKEQDGCRVAFKPISSSGSDWMQYVIPKGSIAVDGVSLTVAALGHHGTRPTWFEVALIPTTLALTTLGEAVTGQRVNLEMDTIAKTIIHWTRHYTI